MASFQDIPENEMHEMHEEFEEMSVGDDDNQEIPSEPSMSDSSSESENSIDDSKDNPSDSSSDSNDDSKDNIIEMCDYCEEHFNYQLDRVECFFNEKSCKECMNKYIDSNNLCNCDECLEDQSMYDESDTDISSIATEEYEGESDSSIMSEEVNGNEPLIVQKINKEQKDVNYILDTKNFKAVVRDISKELEFDVEWSNEAIDALQTVTEDYMVKMLSTSALNANHRNVETIDVKDLYHTNNVLTNLFLN